MLNPLIDQSKLLAANSLLQSANHIVILTHISPDGDAMGSSLAMLHYLQASGKADVHIVVPNPFPHFLAWLPAASDIVIYETQAEQATNLIRNADLLLCLDFNDLKRIGKLEPIVAAATAKRLMIDHHIDPMQGIDVLISHPEASSTSELIYRFIDALHSTNLLNHDIAQCIYTGMMTDTGNFSYNSADPELYIIMSELLRFDVDKDLTYNRVFNTYSPERLRLVGYCLYHKMKLYKINKQYAVALIAISRPELLRFNFQSGDAEGIVNMPMQIETVRYSCFMREDIDKIKISFRSQGDDHPVNLYAEEFFNGGGHKNAAGGEFYGTLDAAVKQFENTFRNTFN